jgi:hypothetical protein
MKSSKQERSSDAETASFDRAPPKASDESVEPAQEDITPPKSSSPATAQNKKLSEWLRRISQQSMVRLVDAVFDLLQMCAYEINQATEGTELELSWLRPAPEKEKHLPEGEVSTKEAAVSGRISTRYWTLVVRGKALEICIFILPAEKLLGFNANPDVLEPYGKLVARPLGTGVGWYIEDTLLEREHVTLIGKHLMETLMKCARHEKLNPNGFTTTLLGINSTDTQEREIQRQYREQFFADLKARLQATSGSFAKVTRGETSWQGEVPATRSLSISTDSWASKETQKEIEPVLPANGWNSIERTTQHDTAQTRPTQEETAQSRPTEEDTARTRPTQEDSPQSRPTAELPAAEKKTAEQAVAPPNTSQTNSDQELSNQTNIGSPDAGSANMIENEVAPVVVSDKASSVAVHNSPPISLPQALQIVMDSLDLELEAVSQAGAQAFNDRDFARAQAILEFSSRLSEFRQSAKQLYDDYQGES